MGAGAGALAGVGTLAGAGRVLGVGRVAGRFGRAGCWESPQPGAASTHTPPVLTTRFGGDVPVRRTPAGLQAAHKLYRAEMQVADPDLVLRPGMSGRARIQLGRRSVGAWLWNTLCDQLSLNLLLKWR